MRRTLATVAVLASTLALGTACGDAETPAAGGSSSASGTAQTKTIDVTFSGDSVTPSGERVDVAVGQPIELDVTAEEAGEIHVHSTPEQELEYDAGSTTLKLTIDTPGVVDVESHSLDQVIVQLEVR